MTQQDLAMLPGVSFESVFDTIPRITTNLFLGVCSCGSFLGVGLAVVVEVGGGVRRELIV